jgi:hypothetical protein
MYAKRKRYRVIIEKKTEKRTIRHTYRKRKRAHCEKLA